MSAFASVCAGALVLLSTVASAQIELVDPDVAEWKKKQKPPPTKDDSVDETTDPGETGAEPDEEPAEVATPRKNNGSAVGKKDAGTPSDAGATATGATAGGSVTRTEVKKDPTKPAPPQLVVSPMSDAQLDQAWAAWRAVSTGDVAKEQAARAALVAIKRRIGASNLEAWASGLLHASAAREEAGDSGAAVEMAVTASELAPELPAAWTGLALAYFRADPTEFGRVVSALKTSLELQLKDPRYFKPMLADVAATLLLALLGTAMSVVLVLILKRGYYFLYDFHFLFPRAAARWQTTALAIIVVSMPLVFRLGLVPVLLGLFAAVTLYVTMAERVVAAVLIGLLGLVPAVGGWVTKQTAFAGTRAEQLYTLERGGNGVEVLMTELSTLAAEDKATFAELSVLGRAELRRGQLEAATNHLKQALTLRPTDVAARVNLGVALLLQGDLENPKALFTNAKNDDPTLVAAPYNLGRLYQRRFATLGDRAAGEADSATGEFIEAHHRDPNFDERAAEAPIAPGTVLEANDYLMTVPLPNSELLSLAVAGDAPKRVASQLTQLIAGDVGDGVALFYPAVLAGLIVGLGLLARPLQAARVCAKCGRPVSRRGDPDVSLGSLMCTQCVNVFAKKNVVATSQKVRKQLEVARYQNQTERASYVLGLTFSGLGHVFAGWPIRGALYAYIFLSALLGFVMRHGLLRAPYEPFPLVLRMAPLVVIFVAVYFVSLRELRKKQG